VGQLALGQLACWGRRIARPTGLGCGICDGLDGPRLDDREAALQQEESALEEFIGEDGSDRGQDECNTERRRKTGGRPDHVHRFDGGVVVDVQTVGDLAPLD